MQIRILKYFINQYETLSYSIKSLLNYDRTLNLENTKFISIHQSVCQFRDNIKIKL